MALGRQLAAREEFVPEAQCMHVSLSDGSITQFWRDLELQHKKRSHRLPVVDGRGALEHRKEAGKESMPPAVIGSAPPWGTGVRQGSLRAVWTQGTGRALGSQNSHQEALLTPRKGRLLGLCRD